MHTHCLITSNMNAFLAATNHNTNMKHFLPPLHTLCVFSSASLLWRYYFYCSLALLAHKILPSVTMKILSTLAQCVWLRCQNQRNNWTQRAELNSNAGKKIVHFCSEHFAKWIIIFIWFLRLKCTHKNDTPTIPLLRFRALLHSRFQYNTPFFLWWCEFANCTYVCVCRHSSVYYNAKARRSPLCAGTKNKESSLLLFFRFVLLFTMPICGIVSNREKNTTSGNWMCVYLCASVPSYNTWKTIPTEINLMNEHWTYFFLELEINNLWLFVCK